MRLLIVLALLLCATPAFAIDAGVPKDLHEADYITAVDVEAQVPGGELFIDEAVIAIFPRLEDRLSGMLVGRVRLKLRPRSGGVQVEAGKTARPMEFRIEQAFLSASLSSEVKIAPKGRALAARRWDGLKQRERDEFLRIYNETRSDDWQASSGDGSVTTRDPRDEEFFTAFWAKPPRTAGGAAGQEVQRYDFRVDASGDTVSLTDRTSATVLFQLPEPSAAAPSDTSP